MKAMFMIPKTPYRRRFPRMFCIVQSVAKRFVDHEKSVTAERQVNSSVLRAVLTAALLALISVLLAGCGFTQAKKDAEGALAAHFQTIATNGFDNAMAHYGTEFFQQTTKEQWTKALTKINSKLGAYQSHTITKWRVFKKAGTSGAGTTVHLECQVTYSKHPATETFTVFKGTSDSDYKIIGHQINSTALLTE